MEDEAYERAFYLAWVFYPCFIIIGIGQIILFWLYNDKYHPFSEILKGVKKQGMPKVSTLCFKPRDSRRAPNNVHVHPSAVPPKKNIFCSMNVEKIREKRIFEIAHWPHELSPI